MKFKYQRTDRQTAMPIASIYGYIPTQWVAILFIVLFSLSTLVHIGQLGYYRKWAFILFILGGIGEIIGWVGRYYSHSNAMNKDAFLTQIVTLIMAPAFYQAAIYVILGYIVKQGGSQHSRLKPLQYSIIFLICDLLSLILQAIGGSIASSAKDDATQKKGSQIMLGGVVFQMFCMCIFIVLSLEVAWRFHCATHAKGRFSKISPNERQETTQFVSRVFPLAIALVIGCVLLFVRGIYRVVELSEGWDGPIITNENYFIALDAILMILTQVLFNIIYPSRYLVSSKTSPADNQPQTA
eukprot:TRINITY_DN219_c0_g1_i1.p1 TRINITY_DN219_c0_g1~~TRINITY_DN219_c0_g1_i1.p1  ORF type:complete len:297 (+),score=63.06 TRINITY_DN219_c0_g1_i1:114-1004(+)